MGCALSGDEGTARPVAAPSHFGSASHFDSFHTPTAAAKQQERHGANNDEDAIFAHYQQQQTGGRSSSRRGTHHPAAGASNMVFGGGVDGLACATRRPHDSGGAASGTSSVGSAALFARNPLQPASRCTSRSGSRRGDGDGTAGRRGRSMQACNSDSNLGDMEGGSIMDASVQGRCCVRTQIASAVSGGRSWWGGRQRFHGAMVPFQQPNPDTKRAVLLKCIAHRVSQSDCASATACDTGASNASTLQPTTDGCTGESRTADGPRHQQGCGVQDPPPHSTYVLLTHGKRRRRLRARPLSYATLSLQAPLAAALFPDDVALHRSIQLQSHHGDNNASNYNSGYRPHSARQAPYQSGGSVGSTQSALGIRRSMQVSTTNPASSSPAAPTTLSPCPTGVEASIGGGFYFHTTIASAATVLSVVRDPVHCLLPEARLRQCAAVRRVCGRERRARRDESGDYDPPTSRRSGASPQVSSRRQTGKKHNKELEEELLASAFAAVTREALPSCLRALVCPSSSEDEEAAWVDTVVTGFFAQKKRGAQAKRYLLTAGSNRQGPLPANPLALSSSTIMVNGVGGALRGAPMPRVYGRATVHRTARTMPSGDRHMRVTSWLRAHRTTAAPIPHPTSLYEADVAAATGANSGAPNSVDTCHEAATTRTGDQAHVAVIVGSSSDEGILGQRHEEDVGYEIAFNSQFRLHTAPLVVHRRRAVPRTSSPPTLYSVGSGQPVPTANDDGCGSDSDTSSSHSNDSDAISLRSICSDDF